MVLMAQGKALFKKKFLNT
ncbi:UNVERIFIED_CONTAM: hypothetical protein GTU68_034601 [Idotea baltica]|nr:hypothetical protein [Idotea baltica]